MKKTFEPQQNYEESKKKVGYTPRRQTEAATYAAWASSAAWKCTSS